MSSASTQGSVGDIAGPRTKGQWRARLVAGGLMLAGVVIIGAIRSMPTATKDTPPVQAVPVNVTVQRVEPLAELTDTFELTAVVQPNRVVRIAAEVSGRIESYGKRTAEVRWQGGVLPAGSPIDEGEPVAAGDPLVLLNRELLTARHDRAAAQYEYDEQDYQRILALHEQGSAPATEMRWARAKRDMDRADLDEAARSLARATIVAPISGILNHWPMEPGEYAVPGDQVAEIVDIETVKVCADVPERDIGFLHVGQTVEVLPLGGGDAPLTGTITYINALADEATRTTRIEVTVQNRVAADNTNGVTSQPAAAGYRLRSGQIVKTRLTRRMLRDVTMIPLASVIPLEEGKEVFVVREGKAERRPVELGFIRGRSIQAVRGLEPGDLLIVAGQRLVSPGQPVNIVASGDRP